METVAAIISTPALYKKKQKSTGENTTKYGKDRIKDKYRETELTLVFTALKRSIEKQRVSDLAVR